MKWQDTNPLTQTIEDLFWYFLFIPPQMLCVRVLKVMLEKFPSIGQAFAFSVCILLIVLATLF